MTDGWDPFEHNPRERVGRYLVLAAEARATALRMSDPALRACYQRAAEHWVALAAEAEQNMRKDEAGGGSATGRQHAPSV